MTSETETFVPLTDLSGVIRSKNAGPFMITLDVIFKSEDDYRYLKNIDFFSPELIARLYRVSVDDVVTIVYFDPARAVKASVKRHTAAGSPGDSDVYGAQQHAPLLGLRVPTRGKPES
jgi:hypothetical protein